MGKQINEFYIKFEDAINQKDDYEDMQLNMMDTQQPAYRRRNTITSMAGLGDAFASLKKSASEGINNVSRRGSIRGRGSIVGENPLNTSMSKGDGMKKKMGDFFKKKYLDMFAEQQQKK